MPRAEPERSLARGWLGLSLAGALCFAGCAGVLGIDKDYVRASSDGGAGGSTSSGAGGTTSSSSGVGGAAGAGGSGTVPLGDPCASSDQCATGECCTDDACTDTCMVPCTNVNQCPKSEAMGCEHGYCLFSCSVDQDCAQTDFVCHHNCTVCEKKNSQGCN